MFIFLTKNTECINCFNVWEVLLRHRGCFLCNFFGKNVLKIMYCVTFDCDIQQEWDLHVYSWNFPTSKIALKNYCLLINTDLIWNFWVFYYKTSNLFRYNKPKNLLRNLNSHPELTGNVWRESRTTPGRSYNARRQRTDCSMSFFFLRFFEQRK